MIRTYIKAKKLERTLAQAGSPFIMTTLNPDTTELLNISESLRNLPKNPLPDSQKQRKYLTAELAEPAHNSLHLIRRTSYFGMATLAMGVLVTIVLASGSKPGSTLYAYKRKSETLRLSFVADDNAKANLQLSFAENRLAETEAILKDTNADPRTKAAALNELSSQTVATIESVNKVAIAQKNSVLLNRLASINETQVKVISGNQTSEVVKDAAAKALTVAEAGTKTIAEAKRLLVAASNESALAELPTTINGTITAITDKDLTVGKEVIILNDKTEIAQPKNSESKTILKVGITVSVSAVKTGDKLTAKNITVTSLPGKVKAAADSANTQDKDAPKDSTAIPTEAATEPDTLQSGFQVESPLPQYPLK